METLKIKLFLSALISCATREGKILVHLILAGECSLGKLHLDVGQAGSLNLRFYYDLTEVVGYIAGEAYQRHGGGFFAKLNHWRANL